MSDHRRGRRPRRYSHHDDKRYYDNYEHPPRRRSLSRKAIDKLQDAMGSLGLGDGSESSSSTRHRSHDYDRDYPRDRHSHVRRHSHRRPYSSSPSRRSRRSRRDSAASSGTRRTASRSRSRWGRGVEAAVDAAAIEAFRLRNEPGPWMGAKAGRIATAAVGAGVIGAVTEKRREETGKSKIGSLGSAVGGLVLNRIVNGPREELR